MLGEIASMLRDEGLRVEVHRASYAAIGGGTAVQERILVYGGDSKLVISRVEGTGYTELRATIFHSIPEHLASMLEEKGAVIDYSSGEPYRITLRLRRPDSLLIRELARIIGGKT